MSTSAHQMAGNQPDEQGHTPYENYKTGEKDSYGRVIKTVLGRHRQFCVYITEEDAVGWHYAHLPDYLRPAIAKFQFLNGIASSTLKKKQRPKIALLLGTALYGALLSHDGKEPENHFEAARVFIYSKGTQFARLAYVLISLASGIVIAGIALGVYRYISINEGIRIGILAGTCGGALGALISIIQRSRRLDMDPLDSELVLGMHGLTRIALGVIFGMLLVAASKADIAFCHFADNPWALFGLAAAAGFTERWVPELLEHVQE